METTFYIDFMEAFRHLDDSFYTQLCEMPNSFSEESKQLARELALIRLCSLIDAYRIDITSLLLKTNHNALKRTKANISHVVLLEMAGWEQIYEYIVRCEVDNLTKVAYGTWISNLTDPQFLPNLKLDQIKIMQLEEIISTRNILIHNKGLVDNEYQRRSGAWYGRNGHPIPDIGTRRVVDNDYYRNTARCILHVMSAIDSEVALAT